MAAMKGRNITFTWKGTAVEGVREKGIALNGAPIDVTSDEDSGWRTLLTVSAQDEVNISISGVTKNETLRQDWFAGTRTGAVIISYPDGGDIAGDFYIASYTETGAYNDAVTFQAELQSTGAVDFDPATT